jgi:hypothetical protein
MSEPKSRRIPHQIWFAAVAVLMAGMWVVLAVWLPYYREQVVIREIKRVGGDVTTYSDSPALYDKRPEWIKSGPEWFQEIVEDGWLAWFDSVWLVNLNRTTVSDEGLKRLSGLTKLTTLHLNDTQVSDEGLKPLSGLTNLTKLVLSNTQSSDKGSKHLSRRYCRKLCS